MSPAQILLNSLVNLVLNQSIIGGTSHGQDLNPSQNSTCNKVKSLSLLSAIVVFFFFFFSLPPPPLVSHQLRGRSRQSFGTPNKTTITDRIYRQNQQQLILKFTFSLWFLLPCFSDFKGFPLFLNKYLIKSLIFPCFVSSYT